MTSIKAKANKFKRTFTIRKFEDGKVIAKFRTLPVSRIEFEDLEYNTENDWIDYLNTSNNCIAL